LDGPRGPLEVTPFHAEKVGILSVIEKHLALHYVMWDGATF